MWIFSWQIFMVSAIGKYEPILYAVWLSIQMTHWYNLRSSSMFTTKLQQIHEYRWYKLCSWLKVFVLLLYKYILLVYYLLLTGININPGQIIQRYHSNAIKFISNPHVVMSWFTTKYHTGKLSALGYYFQTFNLGNRRENWKKKMMKKICAPII